MSVEQSVAKPIPLRLFLLAHPKSESAALLAQELMRRFVDPPASGGLRLPVFFTPDRGDGKPPEWGGDDGINLDAAAHTLVVVLADAVMAQTVDGGTGDEWTAFLEEGIQHAQPSRAHMVFGVAIGKEGYLLSGNRHMVGVSEAPDGLNPGESPTDFKTRIQPWLDSAADDAALHITIRALQLLEPKAQEATPGSPKKLPVQLFLSHAKADLKPGEEDPVRDVEDSIKELPIQHWFDAQDIPPADEFEKVIGDGIRDCSIVVAFLTDHYASRFYCQWEILKAKEMDVPILVVDALATGETRNFPYLGNLPTLRWDSADRPRSARRIVQQAVREALRFMHNRASLTALAANAPKDDPPVDKILASAPEALTLHWSPADAASRVFLYPDPPLPKHELDVLKSLRRQADFVTPLTKVARRMRSQPARTIAVSISESGDLARYGLGKLHEQTLSDEIYLDLLMAGQSIAYGGLLKPKLKAQPGQPSTTDSTTNFTERLFDLVRGYSQLASNTNATLAPILNIPPWPVWLAYNANVLKLFGKTAKLKKGARPSATEVPESDDVLFPSGNPFNKELPDTPERRLAWTRGLTLMRQQMTDLKECQARVIIGGKLAGFSGLYPGVVEEAWMSIVAKQPLYLVGFLGGAARAVIDLLEGRDRPEVRQPNLGKNAPPITDILKLAEQRGLTVIGPGDELPNPLDLTGKLIHPDRIATDIQSACRNGLKAALNNGLEEDENKELFRSTDPPRIAELILTGLSR